MQPKKGSVASKTRKVNPMLSPHDPLEEMRLAERVQEDTYFHKIDKEFIAALRQKSAEEIEQFARQYTRMRCPKCGESLRKTPYRRIQVESCPACGGIWLDQEEVETLVGREEEGWLQRFFEGLMASKP